jgi:hypothetical protein
MHAGWLQPGFSMRQDSAYRCWHMIFCGQSDRVFSSICVWAPPANRKRIVWQPAYAARQSALHTALQRFVFCAASACMLTGTCVLHETGICAYECWHVVFCGRSDRVFSAAGVVSCLLTGRASSGPFLGPQRTKAAFSHEIRHLPVA